MKKILVTLLAALVCISLFAEPGSRKEERRARKDSIKVAQMVGAHQKGTKIKLDGIVLTPEQKSLLLSDIDSVDFNPAWKQYARQRRTGNGLVIGGSCLIGAGAACEVVALGYVLVGVIVAAFSFGQADLDQLMKPAGYLAVGGVASAAVGAGGLAVGIPIRVKADKKMKAVCEQYNNATVRVEKEVIFGGTASGVGIALNF